MWWHFMAVFLSGRNKIERVLRNRSRSNRKYFVEPKPYLVIAAPASQLQSWNCVCLLLFFKLMSSFYFIFYFICNWFLEYLNIAESEIFKFNLWKTSFKKKKNIGYYCIKSRNEAEVRRESGVGAVIKLFCSSVTLSWTV